LSGENERRHDKSMDVSGKQRLSYQSCVFALCLRAAGLPRHLNRYAASIVCDGGFFRVRE
jgi:hypothetical protein